MPLTWPRARTRFLALRAVGRPPAPAFTAPPATLSPDALQNLAFYVPVLLLSMVAHEYAHGYAALRQGDTTALQLGRLTWNPMRHIDPFMTVLMPLMTWFGSNGGFMFGGAKPVPVNPRNYRKFKRGDIIVSLAGVVTNFALALVAAALIPLFGQIGRAVPGLNDTCAILQVMMVFGIQVNLLLVAFNLLPIPPLDGSHVMKYLLPPALSLQYQRIGAYGFLILVLFLTVGRPLLVWWMRPATYLGQMLISLVRPSVLVSPWTS
jgi:Zn-dependent protease